MGYELTKNIDTTNRVRIGYYEFGDIVCDVHSATSTRERRRYVVGRPSWRSVS